jgi:para-aminobenzoate synthetase / 4-amino-4-deoxychorismate lyase
MIQARFDDLRPGSERAFRVVEPVGILEADRPDEVGATIEAAEAAASRGLWVAGFVAYEAAPGLDPHLSVHRRSADEGPPLAWFGMFERVEEVPALTEPVDPPEPAEGWTPSTDRATYERDIETIREAIAAGETYQVNHTIRLYARIAGDERGLYRDLCLAQRGGYGAYLNTGRFRVCSASPELFFRIDRDRITTRPMKGTAARGRWLEEDEAVAARLVSSAKDRAENAMIVDLLRSDLGRIARPGSVRVETMFEPERYETVWQLTSTVSAELEPRTSLVDAFRALFPSGSVTGAPKVRTMRIIADLERSPRGVYCGAIGYLAPEGSGEPGANFSVAIRTVVLDAESRSAEYGVGGGITHGSSAAGEYAEVLAKARVLSAARPAFRLFETLRHEVDGGFRHLEEHLARLGSSAAYLGFGFDAETAVEALEKAVADAGGGPVRARLTLARDGTLAVEVSEPSDGTGGPVRLAIDDEPVDPSDVWLYHKTTNRRPYERRRERHPDADDVLLVNERGEVTESTIANVAVRLDSAWVTPPRDAGLLAGTYREVLLREGRLVERSVPLDELRAAEEIALVSSVRGWREAMLIA